eukprot:TRINITY_DN11927_c0_g1_i13.p3 TRINITY_DN11927_c0_g1~~TRINITY_DN11927_c0_g1_i13.p3  ORF type:complete len:126 (+),score=8.48 TRINITY_DN11927_c0_g1_i13:1307-1684(+)
MLACMRGSKDRNLVRYDATRMINCRTFNVSATLYLIHANYRSYCYHESPRFSILHEDVKYLVNPDGSRPEMYNLTQRTFEALGVLQDNQMLATHLQQQLFNWSTTLVPDVIRARHQGCLNYHYPT